MYSATVQQRRKYEAGSSYLPLACCPVRPQNGRAQVITTGTSAKRVRFRGMEGGEVRLRCSGLWRTWYKFVRKQSINCLINTSRSDEWIIAFLAFAKHCLLTGQEQACSRITRLVGCPHAENGLIHRKLVVDCPTGHSDHIHRWYPFPDQTKPGMRNNRPSKSFA